MANTVTTLAIETSCDETGVAIVSKKENSLPQVISSALASQIDIHAATGGVIPEVAARQHVTVIQPLIKQVIEESGVAPSGITAVAVTSTPGLMPALSVGVSAAQTLAYAWQKPIIPIHHLEGHIYSALLRDEPIFPALALIVSGGHTMLIEVSGHLQYKVIGTTRDDAAGEAFDKIARLLGYPYPGGPHLSSAAKMGDPKAFKFSRPMSASPDLDFSFSGLKTEVLYKIRETYPAINEQKNTYEIPEEDKCNIAASFEAAAVDALVIKTKQAIEKLNPKTTLLAGGVAANQLLRQKLSELAKKQTVELRIAPPELCGDNAIMIGQVATYAYDLGRQKKWQEIDAQARQPITDFNQAGLS